MALRNPTLREVLDQYVLVENDSGKVVSHSINEGDAFDEEDDGDLELYWSNNFAEYNFYCDPDQEVGLNGDTFTVQDKYDGCSLELRAYTIVRLAQVEA